MYDPTPISVYPMSTLPSLRMCLLSLVAGIVLAWLYSTGWLVLTLALLFVTSFSVVGMYLCCIAVGGKAD